MVRNTAEYSTADEREVEANSGSTPNMATSCSSLGTSESASNDGFGNFMRNLEEKSSEEIDRNYLSRQKGVLLRKYLVLHQALGFHGNDRFRYRVVTVWLK